tara:strand:- start:2582 stop:2920 length:339 start_codon:yes stop_codon:yes gene_type:complete
MVLGMTQEQMGKVVIAYLTELWHLDVVVNLQLVKSNSTPGAWGCSSPHPTQANKYDMTICIDQNTRNFIATVCHEMVHIKQWHRGKWRGDGEREASRMQYRLADRVWKLGLI